MHDSSAARVRAAGPAAAGSRAVEPIGAILARRWACEIHDRGAAVAPVQAVLADMGAVAAPV
jgi:hypothetical protein